MIKILDQVINTEDTSGVGNLLPALDYFTPVEEQAEEIVVLDEESMTIINTETGEVIGLKDTPPEDIPVVELAKWIGERRDWHKGRLAGLIAEKQHHLDKIAKVYDPQINNHTRALAWMGKQYYELLMGLALALIGENKKRSIAVGTLLLKLRKTRASVDVSDDKKATAYLDWLIQNQQDKIGSLKEKAERAGDDDTGDYMLGEIDKENMLMENLIACLNVKRSVFKSSLPDGLKAKLTPEHAEATGMLYTPGGEEKLEIE